MTVAAAWQGLVAADMYVAGVAFITLVVLAIVVTAVGVLWEEHWARARGRRRRRGE